METRYKTCIKKQGKDIMFKYEDNVVTLSFNTISTVSFRYTGQKKKYRWDVRCHRKFHYWNIRV